jgi:hypothetical protein
MLSTWQLIKWYMNFSLSHTVLLNANFLVIYVWPHLWGNNFCHKKTPMTRSCVTSWMIFHDDDSMRCGYLHNSQYYKYSLVTKIQSCTTSNFRHGKIISNSGSSSNSNATKAAGWGVMAHLLQITSYSNEAHVFIA